MDLCYGRLVTTGISENAIAAAVDRLRAAGCVFAEDERTRATRVARRALGEPLEQVVGYADFCGIRVRLRPGVFVPRVRSELLVRTAAAHITARTGKAGAVVVDMCCGSGALGLALRHLHPEIRLHAADIDPVAVACARDNLDPVAGHGGVHQGDLFA